MDSMSNYRERMKALGLTKRETALQRELRNIETKLPNNLSYTKVTINGIPQNVAVINTGKLNEKTIISMPNTDLANGGLVYWMDNYWLIIERDANQTVYTKGLMKQCNYLLKWIDTDKNIHEQWCIIENSTQWNDGETSGSGKIMALGDTRIGMTIARNADTLKFNRDSRFLIDDPDVEKKLAYRLTNRFRYGSVGSVYNNEGIFNFTLGEEQSTKYDNHILGIADYFKYFPKDADEEAEDNSSSSNESNTGRGGWL